MKKILALVLAAIMALGFVGCSSSGEQSSSKNKSALSNDYIDIDGVYIDTSFNDANKKLVYLFYNLKAQDKNLTASRYLLDLNVNDSNQYTAVTSKDYIPKYTEYYYSDFNEDVYVGTSLKVCQTYEIPNGDLVDGKIIKLKTSDEQINVDDLSISFSDIKALNGIKEIAQDLNTTVYSTKLEQENKLLAPVDAKTEKLVRNGLNDRYWQFYAKPFSYKIEFSAPNKFTIETSALTNTGTYSVKAGYIVLYYPSNNTEIAIEYTRNNDGTPAFDNNGSIMLPTIADTFVAGADYDGRK